MLTYGLQIASSNVGGQGATPRGRNADVSLLKAKSVINMMGKKAILIKFSSDFQKN